MSTAGSLNVTPVSHFSPPNGTTWMSTPPRGKNTMLVSPTPCTPTITSAEFTSAANVAHVRVLVGLRHPHTSNPASVAARAISRFFFLSNTHERLEGAFADVGHGHGVGVVVARSYGLVFHSRSILLT